MELRWWNDTRHSWEMATDGAITPSIGAAFGARPRPIPIDAATDEFWVGTAGDDIKSGTALADNLSGAGGDDMIDGLGGNDILHRNAGDDTQRGGDGDDYIAGSADDINGTNGAQTAPAAHYPMVSRTAQALAEQLGCRTARASRHYLRPERERPLARGQQP